MRKLLLDGTEAHMGFSEGSDIILIWFLLLRERQTDREKQRERLPWLLGSMVFSGCLPDRHLICLSFAVPITTLVPQNVEVGEGRVVRWGGGGGGGGGGQGGSSCLYPYEFWLTGELDWFHWGGSLVRHGANTGRRLISTVDVVCTLFT